MTLEQWAYIGEIAAAIAVIASLIYVAQQLKQNTELLRSGSRQALLNADQRALQLAFDNADLLETITKPEKMSFQDQWRFSAMWAIDMRNREHEYFQYKAGVLDEETWLSYRQVLYVNFGIERGRKWWNAVGRETFAPEFVAMVDDLIAKTQMRDFVTGLGDWD